MRSEGYSSRSVILSVCLSVTMHRQLQTCSSVADVCSVTQVWMAFSVVESSYFCPIVNVTTYTSVNVIFVYVSTIYFQYKVVTKFRFQCSNIYFYMCMCPQYIFHVRQ